MEDDSRIPDDQLQELIETNGGRFVDDGDEFYLNDILLDSDNVSDALYEAWCLVRPSNE